MNGNGSSQNGHAVQLKELVDNGDLDVLHLQNLVPIEYYMQQILEKLTPRATQRLLIYYANKMNELI